MGVLRELDAVDKVAHVVVADINPLGILGQFLREDFPVVGLNDASRDPDPALRSDELDAVLLALGIFDAAVPFAGGGALAGMDDTVGIGVCHRVLARRRETPGNHIDQLLAFDADRPGAILIEGPQDDVIVVPRPNRSWCRRNTPTNSGS